MIESALERIAENIMALDEASLSSLWEKYKVRMEDFDASREWEKAVIIFFIINSVRIKNKIFNDRVMEKQGQRSPETPPDNRPSGGKPSLKRIK